MTIIVQFMERGEPAQISVGLDGSAALGAWEFDAAETAALARIDTLPWGQRPADTPAAVRDAGAVLRTKLAGLAALRKALIDAFAAGANAPRPLYFRIGVDPTVEAAPFEVLWDEHLNGFPCLQPYWPIARIVADAAVRPNTVTMEKVVRIVAVLAAEHVDPTGQLDALRAACDARPDLRIETTVITSCERIITTVQGWGLPGWQAEVVPLTTDDLIARLRTLQPHLLHVFCHGTADGPRLLVAQHDDLAVLELSSAHFAALAVPAVLAPWLVTLNCCESAAGGDGTVSLASGMVRNGMPAVLGMRRAIEIGVADTFCGALYTAVLGRLTEIAPTGPALSPLSWADVLHEPRRRLSALHGATSDVAGRQKEWTIPVLYLATPQVLIRGRPTAELDAATIQEEVNSLGMTDQLEVDGNATPATAARMRAVTLARLYPAVQP